MIATESKAELILVDPDHHEIVGCSSKEAVCIRKMIESLLQNGEAQTFQVLCISPAQATWISGATEELAKKLGPNSFQIGVIGNGQANNSDVCFLSIGSSGLTGVSDFELKSEIIESAVGASKQKTYILASPFFVEQAASPRNPYLKSRQQWIELAKPLDN